MELDEQPGEKTPAERLIASRLRSMQYRLTTVFGVMLFVGILLAIPRFIGMDYKWYFQFLYMIAYGCAPFMGWLTYAILPNRFGTWRLIASSIVALALIVPFWSLIAWYDSEHELVMAIIVTCIIFWMPQVICIWMVWFFVFRSSSRRR